MPARDSNTNPHNPPALGTSLSSSWRSPPRINGFAAVQPNSHRASTSNESIDDADVDGVNGASTTAGPSRSFGQMFDSSARDKGSEGGGATSMGRSGTYGSLESGPSAPRGGVRQTKQQSFSPVDSTGNGFVASMMRKVSGGKSPSVNGAGSDAEVGTMGVRRNKSQDLDDRYSHLSASAKAIRDSSNRLASLSFASSHFSRPSVSALSHTSSSNEPVSSLSPLSSRWSQPMTGSPSRSTGASHPQRHTHLNETILPTLAGSSGSPAGISPRDVGARTFDSDDLLDDKTAGTSDEIVGSTGSYMPRSTANVGRSGLSMMMDRAKAKSTQPGSSPIKEATELEEESTPRPPKEQLDIDSPTPSVPPSASSSEASRLAILAEKALSPSTPATVKGGASTGSASFTQTPTPLNGTSGIIVEPTEEQTAEASDTLKQYLADEQPDEATPLMAQGAGNGYSEDQEAGMGLKRRRSYLANSSWEVRQKLGKLSWKDLALACIVDPVKTLPSVILGMLLNVLDGVSYGMILFPATPVFQNFGSLGVSMFFMSCIVSQLVFSLGGSIFPAGNGSMMIEAVPFFHILVNIIQTEVGNDDRVVIATTMVAFAFSSILTGLVFFLLGAFKLGTLVGYFPRHILVGILSCIGGVGVFLIETGLQVSRGLKEEGFQYNLATLKLFLESPHAILLWSIPLVLAILLRVITHYNNHQLIFPVYFFMIPVVFYIIVFAGHFDLAELRKSGWIMDVGTDTQAWWKFYTYFDFKKTNWAAFWAGMPTQLALVFFGILHVPLNVPALGVTLCEDNVKLDRELVAHGVSNLAAGLTGTVPNYLTYVNSVLFYRVGGGSRLSGLMLALGTVIIMMVGPKVIGYLPVAVVAALIYVLGIDLLIEAVWDTRHKVNKSEYITIWAIAIGMTMWDFVIGLLFGIILACIFFVVQNSRRRAIRSVFNGTTAKSTVRRPRPQRAFIQQVGSQTYVMKLQGFLFFGTISAVEDEIRKLLDLAKWQHNPIRFLIIDFALVPALDFSSAEAFARVQRLLAAKGVLLILCGAAPNGLVGSALQAVGLWADAAECDVMVFESLNEALEWAENSYLSAFYERERRRQQEGEETRSQIIEFPKVTKAPPFSLAQSFQNSPRRTHLAKAGGDTLPRTYIPLPPEEEQPVVAPTQSFLLLEQTLGTYAPSTFTPEDYETIINYLERVALTSGETLWKQNDPADDLYFIESGSLRATYTYGNHGKYISETMVAGTIAGDLSMLSDTKRNATVVAESNCVLWALKRERLSDMERDEPALAMKFVRVILKAVAEEQDVLSSHLIAMLS